MTRSHLLLPMRDEWLADNLFFSSKMMARYDEMTLFSFSGSLLPSITDLVKWLALRGYFRCGLLAR